MAVGTNPKFCSWLELLAMFPKEVWVALEELRAREDVSHIVVFENPMLDSSQCGRRTAVAIGPGCTYKTLDEVRGRCLGQTPSVQQWPAYYFAKEEPGGQRPHDGVPGA